MSNLIHAPEPAVNELIIAKLRRYPAPVAELAAKAIQISEDLPEATVTETLQTAVREVLARHEGDA